MRWRSSWLGYGVSGGSEAVVHAARDFLNNMDTCQAVVKLDFPNSFNCMLKAVQSLCPSLNAFVYPAYAKPSNLPWGDKIITSAEGVHQGDPMGPLMFCLVLPQQSLQLKSDFKALYLDESP